MHNLIEAHVKAYDIISIVDDMDADGDGIPKQAGFSHLMVVVKPATRKRMIDRGVTNVEAARSFPILSMTISSMLLLKAKRT